ncbi:MAG TPA: helix-turn-helix domain-containing protein [Nitrospiraceae bacterium]|nr:helix-turn-helix domain-containing protein [Nitrospiraceae bacterium]
MHPAHDLKLLTVRDLAHRLQINPSTLYAWAAQGRIPCLKIHGVVRFRREEIERWLESFKAQEPATASKAAASGSRTALDALLARAKRHAYTPRPRGNQTRSSLIRKEETDGAV